MKIEQQAQAIELRRSGKSIKEIEAIIGCSRSSVSRWVKDIALTEDQKNELISRNPAYNHQCKGTKANSKKFEKLREQYKKEGFDKAGDMDPLHVAACMLYWAEGWKSVNVTRLVNSDPKMLKLFISFAKKHFHADESDFSIRINCYTDMCDLNEIEGYWLRTLGLPRTCLRKGTVNYYSSYSKKKRKGKCKYGTCALTIRKGVRIVQHIYGAIDRYAQMT